MKTRFGPAGIPISCKGDNIEGLKHSIGLGLRAYEVQFGHGVKMSPRMARELQLIREESGVRVSCHAPYYLNCNNAEKYATTKRHLHDCIKVSQYLPFTRIVFHTGYLMKMERSKALKNSIQALKLIIKEARAKGYKDFTLGPEVAGKTYQIGDLSEIITICKEIPECEPVIDWGHYNARNNGCLKSKSDYLRVIEALRDELGKKSLKNLHCHFSNIEYNAKGEVNHYPLGSEWGPRFEPLAELIKENDYEFTIISESPLIEQDALKMKKVLLKTWKLTKDT